MLLSHVPTLSSRWPTAGASSRRLHLHFVRAEDRHCLLRALGIDPHIPKRGQYEANHLGHQRWQVERTLSWLKQLRRLRIRWDRQSEIHEAFLHLAFSLIVWRQLNR